MVACFTLKYHVLQKFESSRSLFITIFHILLFLIIVGYSVEDKIVKMFVVFYDSCTHICLWLEMVQAGGFSMLRISDILHSCTCEHSYQNTMIIMYKSTVFICEIDNASSLNSEEPCVVEDEKEEEEQLQLLEENERFFGLLWLLGLDAAVFIAGIMLYETQGKTEGPFHMTITII